MLVEQLIQTNYPSLQIADNVSFALQLLDDYDVQDLPLVNNNKFVGLVNKSDLLNEDESLLLSDIQIQPHFIAVKKDAFITEALKLFTEQQVSIVAVINDQLELLGIITQQNILKQLSKFLGTTEPGAIIVLEVERRNYSFGEISRLVETNDAYITQLNTYTESDTGFVLVCLKVNKIEVSDIVSTFNRYDYVVRYFFGEEQYTNELKQNYNHLMAYLNL